MFHYIIFLSKEREGELASLPFCFEADVGVDAEVLEAEWLAVFNDPHRSWPWLSDLSLSSADGDKMKAETFIQLVHARPIPVT